MFQIFDGNGMFQVGEDTITVGGFIEEPLKIIVRGPVPARIVSDNSPISKDKILWQNTIDVDFAEMNEVFYVKEADDRDVRTEITVEAV